MTARTVTVHLKAKVGDYLAGMKMSEKAAKDLRQETDKLNKSAAGMTRGGIITALAGVPGVASAAAAGLGAIPAFALGSAAAFGTLAIATNGVGDAMSAVAEGDAKKLKEAMAELSVNAQEFVLEYQRIRPALSALGDSTQDAFFGRLLGNLDLLTSTYLPVLMRQAPRVASELGKGGSALAAWATAPSTVAKVNGQFDLAVDLTADLNRLLRAGLGLFLDLADAGAGFARGTVGGLADGAEALERWVGNARATGQLNDIFDSGTRILERLGQVAGQAGELLADIVDNPALVDGAEALFDVLGMGLDVVRALLTAFEALPPGLQTGIVTLAVFGGAAVSVTGRILALKASLESMKLSAIQAGVAVKSVGSFLGGPWGIAIGLATVAIGVFATNQWEAKAAADGLRGTLDEQTGAITAATREQVYNNLATEGAIDIAKEYGLDLNEVVAAVLGGKDAANDYTRQLVLQAEAEGKSSAGLSNLVTKLSAAGAAVDAAKTGWRDKAGVMSAAGGVIDATTGKVKAQTSAIKELGDVLRAQSDPAFALIKAQKDQAKAQADYNKAVKEHGRNSREAKDASLALAESAVKLAGAVSGAADVFTGKLTPEMRAALEAAHLTDQQIRDIEESFKAAAAAGDKFAGDYNANVTANTKAADVALEKLIEKLLKLKNKTINVSANVYYNDKGLHVGTGTQLRRWGGIDYAMAQGGTIQAHHATSPTVLYGERATGGEAFIPKNGDRARNLSILSTAAGWNGMQIMPANLPTYTSGGGGGGGPVMVEMELVIRGENGRETRQKLRAEATGRGIPKATVAVAYP